MNMNKQQGALLCFVLAERSLVPITNLRVM